MFCVYRPAICNPMNHSKIRFHVAFLAAALSAVSVHGDDTTPYDAKKSAVPPVTVIEGGAPERGAAYGGRFRDAIREFLASEIEAAFAGKPSSKEELIKYAAACGEVVRQECPLIAKEFAGIAKGAGLTFEEIVLINLHEELYHRAPVPVPDRPKPGHCTAVAVSASDSGDAKTYVGQTWDWMQSVAGKSRILEWRREGGVSVLAYGFPGMPMGAGLNSSGIALCWTSAALGDKDQSPCVGIPSYMLIAHLLAQRDLESVVREAKKNKHAGWFTFVMADGRGNLLNIEGSPGKIAIERANQRMSRVGYGTREMTGTEPDKTVPVHARCTLMLEHLQSSAGRNALAGLQKYFAAPEFRISEGKATIDMMVFDTTARVAYLSRGPAYHLDWHTFTFGADGK
jgi:hypothetical protein